MTTQLRVPDATCGHCKGAIESAVSGVPGVESANLDLDSKLLSVSHDGTVAEDRLSAAIADAGYSPEAV